MLNIVARTVEEPKETVLLLAWADGWLLALHRDGRLVEYVLDQVRADRMESEMRIATNEQANVELFIEAALDAE